MPALTWLLKGLDETDVHTATNGESLALLYAAGEKLGN